MKGEFPEMKRFFNYRVAAIATLALAAAIFMTFKNENKTTAATGLDMAPNPLTTKWEGPYGGIPPFDKVKIEDFKPALEAAMAENLAEIDKITANKAAPTFENTIAALEKTGHTLERVSTIYDIWSSNMSTAEFEPIETEMAPKLAAFGDKISRTRLCSKG